MSHDPPIRALDHVFVIVKETENRRTVKCSTCHEEHVAVAGFLGFPTIPRGNCPGAPNRGPLHPSILDEIDLRDSGKIRAALGAVDWTERKVAARTARRFAEHLVTLAEEGQDAGSLVDAEQRDKVFQRNWARFADFVKGFGT